MSLPDALQGAVTGWLGTHVGNRRQASASLSETYRAGGSSADIDLGSYLVTRLPATFAAVDRVLAELARPRPDAPLERACAIAKLHGGLGKSRSVFHLVAAKVI